MQMQEIDVCKVDTWSERFQLHGALYLTYIDDTTHMFRYEDEQRVVAVDIDSATLDDKKRTICFPFPRDSGDELLFHVADEMAFSTLSRSTGDCKAICELKLRMESVLRDAYFSGVYMNLDPDPKINIHKEIAKLAKDRPDVFFNSLRSGEGVQERVKKASRKVQEDDSNVVLLGDLNCHFCHASKIKRLVHIEGEEQKLAEVFIMHPFMPFNSRGDRIFFCLACADNWKDYRETAHAEGRMILEGEVNEEICALCSDGTNLIMCSSCPRSFCPDCIDGVLTPAEIEQMHKSDDWYCPGCQQGVLKQSNCIRASWTTVDVRGKSKFGRLAQFSSQPAVDAPTLNLNLSLRVGIKRHAEPDLDLYSLAQSHNSGYGAGSSSSSSREEAPFASNGHARSRARTEELHMTLPIKAPREVPDNTLLSAFDRSEIGDADTADADGADAQDSSAKDAKAKDSRSSAIAKQTAKKPRNSRNTHGDVNDEALPDVDENRDEFYYFGQYVSYYKQMSEELLLHISSLDGGKPDKRKRKKPAFPSDDACFLCKDGGNLVECEWCGDANGAHCLKCYHSYCLDFDPTNENNWVCPRHFCSFCGGKELKYICKYCPLSLCSKCPQKYVEEIGGSRYCVVDNAAAGPWCHAPAAPGGMVDIVCQTCLEHIETISDSVRGDSMTKELQQEQVFPGKYKGVGTGGSIYKANPAEGGFRGGKKGKWTPQEDDTLARVCETYDPTAADCSMSAILALPAMAKLAHRSRAAIVTRLKKIHYDSQLEARAAAAAEAEEGAEGAEEGAEGDSSGLKKRASKPPAHLNDFAVIEGRDGVKPASGRWHAEWAQSADTDKDKDRGERVGRSGPGQVEGQGKGRHRAKRVPGLLMLEQEQDDGGKQEQERERQRQERHRQREEAPEPQKNGDAPRRSGRTVQARED
ncbi:hypothetical protein B484DRAFT_403538 [Ochromonadaceae sp. CCMP2298]|nr:hypothetical protein B484DRAFT_403538 [Ochromonadaceae sp. CCMP2298]